MRGDNHGPPAVAKTHALSVHKIQPQPCRSAYHCKKQLHLSPELQLLTRNSSLWQPAMAIQHAWSTGAAEVATMAGKFA